MATSEVDMLAEDETLRQWDDRRVQDGATALSAPVVDPSTVADRSPLQALGSMIVVRAHAPPRCASLRAYLRRLRVVVRGDAVAVDVDAPRRRVLKICRFAEDRFLNIVAGRQRAAQGGRASARSGHTDATATQVRGSGPHARATVADADEEAQLESDDEAGFMSDDGDVGVRPAHDVAAYPQALRARVREAFVHPAEFTAGFAAMADLITQGDLHGVMRRWKQTDLITYLAMPAHERSHPLLHAVHRFQPDLVAFFVAVGCDVYQAGSVHPYSGDNLSSEAGVHMNTSPRQLLYNLRKVNCVDGFSKKVPSLLREMEELLVDDAQQARAAALERLQWLRSVYVRADAGFSKTEMQELRKRHYSAFALASGPLPGTTADAVPYWEGPGAVFTGDRTNTVALPPVLPAPSTAAAPVPHAVDSLLGLAATAPSAHALVPSSETAMHEPAETDGALYHPEEFSADCFVLLNAITLSACERTPATHDDVSVVVWALRRMLDAAMTGDTEASASDDDFPDTELLGTTGNVEAAVAELRSAGARLCVISGRPCIDVLLQRFSPPRASPSSQDHPLLHAVHRSRPAVVRILLELGFSPDVTGTVHPFSGDDCAVADLQRITARQLSGMLTQRAGLLARGKRRVVEEVYRLVTLTPLDTGPKPAPPATSEPATAAEPRVRRTRVRAHRVPFMTRVLTPTWKHVWDVRARARAHGRQDGVEVVAVDSGSDSDIVMMAATSPRRRRAPTHRRTNAREAPVSVGRRAPRPAGTRRRRESDEDSDEHPHLAFGVDDSSSGPPSSEAETDTFELLDSDGASSLGTPLPSAPPQQRAPRRRGANTLGARRPRLRTGDVLVDATVSSRDGTPALRFMMDIDATATPAQRRAAQPRNQVRRRVLQRQRGADEPVASEPKPRRGSWTLPSDVAPASAVRQRLQTTLHEQRMARKVSSASTLLRDVELPPALHDAHGFLRSAFDAAQLPGEPSRSHEPMHDATPRRQLVQSLALARERAQLDRIAARINVLLSWQRLLQEDVTQTAQPTQGHAAASMYLPSASALLNAAGSTSSTRLLLAHARPAASAAWRRKHLAMATREKIAEADLEPLPAPALPRKLWRAWPLPAVAAPRDTLRAAAAANDGAGADRDARGVSRDDAIVTTPVADNRVHQPAAQSTQSTLPPTAWPASSCSAAALSKLPTAEASSVAASERTSAPATSSVPQLQCSLLVPPSVFPVFPVPAADPPPVHRIALSCPLDAVLREYAGLQEEEDVAIAPGAPLLVPELATPKECSAACSSMRDTLMLLECALDVDAALQHVLTQQLPAFYADLVECESRGSSDDMPAHDDAAGRLNALIGCAAAVMLALSNLPDLLRRDGGDVGPDILNLLVSALRQIVCLYPARLPLVLASVPLLCMPVTPSIAVPAIPIIESVEYRAGEGHVLTASRYLQGVAIAEYALMRCATRAIAQYGLGNLADDHVRATMQQLLCACVATSLQALQLALDCPRACLIPDASEQPRSAWAHIHLLVDAAAHVLAALAGSAGWSVQDTAEAVVHIVIASPTIPSWTSCIPVTAASATGSGLPVSTSKATAWRRAEILMLWNRLLRTHASIDVETSSASSSPSAANVIAALMNVISHRIHDQLCLAAAAPLDEAFDAYAQPVDDGHECAAVAMWQRYTAPIEAASSNARTDALQRTHRVKQVLQRKLAGMDVNFVVRGPAPTPTARTAAADGTLASVLVCAWLQRTAHQGARSLQQHTSITTAFQLMLMRASCVRMEAAALAPSGGDLSSMRPTDWSPIALAWMQHARCLQLNPEMAASLSLFQLPGWALAAAACGLKPRPPADPRIAVLTPTVAAMSAAWEHVDDCQRLVSATLYLCMVSVYAATDTSAGVVPPALRDTWTRIMDTASRNAVVRASATQDGALRVIRITSHAWFRHLCSVALLYAVHVAPEVRQRRLERLLADALDVRRSDAAARALYVQAVWTHAFTTLRDCPDYDAARDWATSRLTSVAEATAQDASTLLSAVAAHGPKPLAPSSASNQPHASGTSKAVASTSPARFVSDAQQHLAVAQLVFDAVLSIGCVDIQASSSAAVPRTSWWLQTVLGGAAVLPMSSSCSHLWDMAAWCFACLNLRQLPKDSARQVRAAARHAVISVLRTMEGILLVPEMLVAQALAKLSAESPATQDALPKQRSAAEDAPWDEFDNELTVPGTLDALDLVEKAAECRARLGPAVVAARSGAGRCLAAASRALKLSPDDTGVPDGVATAERVLLAVLRADQPFTPEMAVVIETLLYERVATCIRTDGAVLVEDPDCLEDLDDDVLHNTRLLAAASRFICRSWIHRMCSLLDATDRHAAQAVFAAAVLRYSPAAAQRATSVWRGLWSEHGYPSKVETLAVHITAAICSAWTCNWQLASASAAVSGVGVADAHVLCSSAPAAPHAWAAMLPTPTVKPMTFVTSLEAPTALSSVLRAAIHSLREHGTAARRAVLCREAAAITCASAMLGTPSSALRALMECRGDAAAWARACIVLSDE